jgi:hypothetical protein
MNKSGCRHRIVFDRPGVYRIKAVPDPLVRRLFRFLFGPVPQPQPTRPCPTLAMTPDGDRLVETITVSLAGLRSARP